MDIITLLLAKQYTDTIFDAVRGGMKYMGEVDTVSDLPTPSEDIKGHEYTVLSNGHEWVCTGVRWADLQAELNEIELTIVSLANRINTLETRPLCPSKGRSNDE